MCRSGQIRTIPQARQPCRIRRAIPACCSSPVLSLVPLLLPPVLSFPPISPCPPPLSWLRLQPPPRLRPPHSPDHRRTGFPAAARWRCRAPVAAPCLHHRG